MIWLGILDVPLELGEATDGAWRAVVGAVLAGVLGAAIGGAVHSQVGALVGALVWIFVAEPLCWALLGLLDVGGVAEYLPAASLGGIMDSGGEGLPFAGSVGMALRVGRARDGARLAPHEQAGHHLAGATLGWSWPRLSARGRSSSSDRVARVRRQRRGTARRLRRLRTRRAPRRSRSRTRDQGEARVRRGRRRELVLEPGPNRVDAPCRHFGTCGGCRFQDLAYDAQLAEKAQQVRDALVRIGRVRGPAARADRARVVRVRVPQQARVLVLAGDDGVELGFHRAGRWDEVIGIEECLLTTDLGNAIRLAVRDWAREERLEAYDQATGEGYLRHLVVREGRNTGQALVVLVTAPGERFETGYLVDVLRRFPEVRSIHWAINDTPAEQTNLPTKLLWGEEAIEEEILGLRFRVRPSAFLQTNTEMAEQLYELAREFAALTG